MRPEENPVLLKMLAPFFEAQCELQTRQRIIDDVKSMKNMFCQNPIHGLAGTDMAVVTAMSKVGRSHVRSSISTGKEKMGDYLYQ